MIVTTKNKRATYSAVGWIRNGGAAIAVDADPNTVGGGGAGSLALLQAAGRVYSAPAGIFIHGQTFINALAQDGTSAVGRFWWYDDVEALWIPSGNVATMTTAAANSLLAVIGAMPGSKWYVQITSNTGVTKIAVVIR